jgi:hypothetical protein
MALQQLIGSLSSPDGDFTALLSVDDDTPNDAALCWTREEATAGGVLMRVTAEPSGNLHLTPIVTYRRLPNGAVVPTAPPLTEEETAFVAGTRATLRVVPGGYAGEWSGSDNAKGELNLSEMPPLRVHARECQTWNAFKHWADQQQAERNALWFRGHGSNTYPLRTTLHREGRRRLERYVANELLAFKYHAEASLNRRFDLNNGDDYSTLLGLAQHHGLPTPMLDWTDSPYIAAFFAFTAALDNRRAGSEATHVRIFTISEKFVLATMPQNVVLAWPKPYVAPLSVAPLHNPRLQAQQGRFMVTNVDEVEGYICGAEERFGERYLFAADMPFSCATEALRDLAFMGLTAATMFPGLDGVGRMIRHEMFFKRPR